jgi:hypothetical protein
VPARRKAEQPADWPAARKLPAREAGQSPAKKEYSMSMTIDVALKEAMRTEGAIGAALVDYGSGMSLGEISVSKELDLTVAAAGNTEVVRAKMRTMEMLKMSDSIEDILITLGRQYHIIRPLTSRNGSGLFLYLALDRNRGNLALARHQMRVVAESIEI